MNNEQAKKAFMEKIVVTIRRHERDMETHHREMKRLTESVEFLNKLKNDPKEFEEYFTANHTVVPRP